MSYFGGTNMASNCIFDFFFPNEGKSTPLHNDLTDDNGKEAIGYSIFNISILLS